MLNCLRVFFFKFHFNVKKKPALHHLDVMIISWYAVYELDSQINVFCISICNNCNMICKFFVGYTLWYSIKIERIFIFWEVSQTQFKQKSENILFIDCTLSICTLIQNDETQRKWRTRTIAIVRNKAHNPDRELVAWNKDIVTVTIRKRVKWIPSIYI